MEKVKRYLLKVLLLLTIIFSAFFCTNYEVNAAEVYESKLTNNETESSNGNISYAQYVTKEMSNPNYWKSRAQSVNKELMTFDEIKKLNQSIINEKETRVYDLETIQKPLKATTVEKFESNGELRQLYIDGEKINQKDYIKKFEEALKTSKFPDGTERGIKVYYGVITKRADMKCWPTDDVIAYSTTDPDDETQSYALNVNEPIVIRDVCVVDGKTFYYSQGKVCSGWINSENIAICSSKEEWTNAWKIDISKKDFLVVLQDKITLESSLSQPETSDVKLMLGAILKLVPQNKIPQNMGERGPWNNYVVYLPTRDKNGKYVRKYALISEHYNISCGFLPMTQANILDIAFTCLGNRYGWGAMLGAMDCSAYTRAIYQCFGLELPRNTTWQQKTPGKVKDISKLSETEKQKYLETVPAGSLLYFTGHTMMYIGSESGRAYVINAAGSLSNSDGVLNVRRMYSVILNPLTARRGSGKTWLSGINSVLTIVPPEYIKGKQNISKTKIEGIKNKEYTGNARKLNIVVKDGNVTLKNGADYTVSYKNNKKVGIATVVITGKGNYTGTVTKTFKINPKGTSLKKLKKGKKQFKATWKVQKAQTSGYEVQYSTTKNFKSGKKKVTIKKNKTTSTIIKKLKKNKKYYVRIRTYKTVNGKKFYSSWSKSKNARIK